MKIINVTLNVDNNYINQSTVTMTSILFNLNKEYSCCFYILARDIKKKPLQYIELEKQFNAKIVLIDSSKYNDYFKKFLLHKYVNSYISSSTLDRLLMFNFLPDDVEFSFYIDCDIIVEKDLSVLLENFNKKKIFASCTDIYFDKYRKRQRKALKGDEDFINWFNHPNDYSYFCAGFFLANIKKCKENNIFDDIREVLNSGKLRRYADQDVLNIVFSQRHRDLIYYLPLKYDVFAPKNPKRYFNDNRFYKTEDIIDAYTDPAVIHYVGFYKPWKTYFCLNFVNRWYKYYKLSPAKFSKLPKFKWRLYHLIIKKISGLYKLNIDD